MMIDRRTYKLANSGEPEKSGKVRMELSRDMHNWFKSIDAKTNDERMQRVIDVNEEYKQLAVYHGHVNNELMHCYELIDRVEEARIISQRNNRILKGLLVGLSTAALIASVGYLAYVQGWFL